MRPATKIIRSTAPSLKDAYDPAPVVDLYTSTNGVWVEGFADYERRDERGRGDQHAAASKQVTFGGVSGIDTTIRLPDVDGKFLVGVFGGYSHSRTKNEDAVFSGRIPDDGGTGDFHTLGVSDDETVIKGGMFGLYGVYAVNSFSADFLVKADILDYERNSIETDVAAEDGTPCGAEVHNKSELANINNYTIAANVQYRIQMGNGTWIEPTVGARYTYADAFDQSVKSTQSNPANKFATHINLDDGKSVRVQGGFRVGRTDDFGNGLLWTNVVTALLYSDVYLDGFVVDTAGGSALDLDESKLRVLGGLRSELVDLDEGMTYYGQVELRSGEDLFGVGGKIGLRYEW